MPLFSLSPEAKARASNRKIVILSPEATKPKAHQQYVQKLRQTGAKKAPRRILDILQDDFKTGENSHDTQTLTVAIDAFRPIMPTIRKDKARLICEDLAKSFKKSQLRAYIEANGQMPLLHAKLTKFQLAEHILRQVWHQSVPQTLKNSHKLRVQTVSVEVTRFEMFLLLSMGGHVLRQIRATLSDLDFNPDKLELILTGSPSQIENAKINLAARLEGYYTEVIDLSFIKKLYMEKYGSFTFEEVGKYIEVYFQHVDGDRYEFAAMNPNQVKRIRRLMLWHLGWNQHRRSLLLMPPADEIEHFSLLPFDDLLAMLWKGRQRSHFVLQDRTAMVASPQLRNNLARFAEASVRELEQQLSVPGDGRPFGVTQYLNNSRDEEYPLAPIADQRTAGLENSRTLVSEERAEDVLDTNRASNTSVTLSGESRDQIYNSLVDFSYREQLNGVAAENVDPPVFTVTLGRVLFEREPLPGLFHTPSKESLGSAYSFNSNIPLAYEKALLTASDSMLDSDDRFQDPHVYSLQFKFEPSPFFEDGDGNNNTKSADKTIASSLDLASQMLNPCIEMWVQLADSQVPDLETLQVVTVEGENSSHVCMPRARADLKVTCQITGRLLTDSDGIGKDSGAEAEEESGPQTRSIDSLLNSIALSHTRIAGQPGIRKFLESSNLDFSGRHPTSFAPYMDVEINGRTVRYLYVNAQYRKEISYEVEGGKAVQLSVVDGGVLGGRRVEVRFIGDYSAGTDREKFDELLDYAVDFVNQL